MNYGKLAAVAFLFLLAGLALTSAQSGTGVGATPPTPDQLKVCLNCHSPRFPPNDTSHLHTGAYDPMGEGSPCYVCAHGPLPGPDDPHPNLEDVAGMGKKPENCWSCHYPHDIQAELGTELGTGNTTAQPPPSSPPSSPLMQWVVMVLAGSTLITGVSLMAVLFSVRKRSVMKSGN